MSHTLTQAPPHAVNAKQAKKAASDRAHATPSRITPANPAQEFGEQVIGSTTRIAIHAPWNLSTAPASARFAVEGDAFSLASSSVLTLPPSVAMKPEDLTNVEANSPHIDFAPRARGAHVGALVIEVWWPGDGHIERQRIALHGRGRDVGDAPDPEPEPAHVLTAEEKREQAQDDARMAADDKRNDWPPYHVTNKFDDAMSNVKNAAAFLAVQQAEGVTLINQEASKFVEVAKHAERSMWWDLAELALNLGTAGLAGYLAGKLLPALLVDAGPDRKAEFSKFTTDALKEGLKRAGKAALEYASSPASSPPQPSPEGGPREYSADKEIAFFGEQRTTLNAQAYQNGLLMTEHRRHLRPLLRTDPKGVMRHLAILQQQLADSAKVAPLIQADATAPQWATCVARLELGFDQARQGSRETLATHTSALRPYHLHGAPDGAAGVLDIMVATAQPPVRVVGARMHGIGKSVVERFRRLNLGSTRMPIRILLRPKDSAPAIITRDEAGRVECLGDLHTIAQYAPDHVGGSEAAAVAGAGRLIDLVLAQSLEEWGVSITTNDATDVAPGKKKS